MKFIILLALASVAVSSPISDPQWIAYKRSFGKSYPTSAVEKMRYRIWKHNLRYIQHHNLKADLNESSHRLGVNAYSDLSNKEFKRMLGFKMNLKKISNKGATFLVPNNVNIPKSIDWREKGYVTPVKNQGQCGSCWAFSSTGSLEGQHFRKTGKLVSLSEQNLVDCSGKFGNHGCDGGLMDNAFTYIKANRGIDTERSYPYKAKSNGTCFFKKIDVGATDTGFVDIPSGSEEKLKAACGTVGPISIAIDASSNSFQLYKSGVYEDYECSNRRLDHGVLLVGYGKFEGKDYWLVKNSWGPSWGMNGYIMMARNKGNMCGVATMASYPTV